jgi:hypothetical protein
MVNKLLYQLIYSRTFLILCVLCSLLIFPGFYNASDGQVKQIGTPKITNYPKSIYKAGTQSWSIDQDSRGVLYFGNNSGMLEFDGQHWQLHPVPNKSIVRVIKYAGNRIYAGAFNDFGYFSPNRKGVLQYHSLIQKDIIPNGEVWKIHIAADSSVYFQSFKNIIHYYPKSGQLKLIAKNHNFQFSFKIDNQIFIQDKGFGLYTIKQDKLEFIEGSSIFSNIEVWSMNRFAGKTIIGTFKNGLFEYDGKTFRPLNFPVNEFLKSNQIFSAVQLGNNLAFGTIQNGVIIIDQKGNIVKHLNLSKGLQNNTVLSLFCDQAHNLWLGLDNGIDYVETNSALSAYLRSTEVGAGYVSVLYKKKIYIGTNQGLFVKNWTPQSDNSPLTKIEGLQGQVWSLAVINGALICGHDKGTYQVDNNKVTELFGKTGSWAFFEMPGHPDKVINGCYDGLYLYKKNANKGITYVSPIKGFFESCRNVEIENDSVLWVCHGSKGIYRVTLNSSLTNVVSVKYYGTNKGIPDLWGINVLKFENKLFFSSPKGFFKYNPATDKMEPDNEMTQLFGKQYNVTKIISGSASSTWFSQNGEIGILTKTEKGYIIDKKPFKQLNGTINNTFEHILTVDPKNVIIATEDGFMHFDPSFHKRYTGKFQCLIRSIVSLPDSILYGGSSENNISSKSKNSSLEIPYSLNNLRFVFSATDYRSSGQIRFSYMLLGYDKQWSEWSSKSEKEYTNLPEGKYLFHVKAQNIDGFESSTATYEFIILPPWYRSIWAYIVYILLIILLLWAIILRLKKRFEREKEIMRQRQKEEIRRKEEEHNRQIKDNQQEIIRLRNEMLQVEVEQQKVQVEKNKKELASLATSITRKNEMLDSIKKTLGNVSDNLQSEQRKKIANIIQSIDKDIRIDEDWENFEHYFDQVHGDFIHRLKETYPQLTPSDLRMCAYLKMNLATKEIAPLLNISVRGVEISRYRLRKKLNLDPNENLVEFMLKI